MPYINKSGQMQDSAPIQQQIIKFFLTIWNLIKLFWATLMGQDVDKAIQRSSRSNGNGANNLNAGSRRNDMNDLNRRNAPSVPGLYGEAPCCGR